MSSQLAKTLRIKQGIARLADAFGYAIIPKWRLPNLGIGNRLRKIFADYSIDTVIDVGANTGQYRDFLRAQVGFSGRIISYEPIPELAEQLKLRAVSDVRWTVHARALGAEPGELTFNVMASPEYSSFLKPIPAEDTDRNRRNTVVRTAVVPLSTLDAEFPANRDLRHAYLKLDTQGFDLQVLRGGKRVISEIQALQTEISFRPIYDAMPDYRESISTIERHGFAVADFFLVATDGINRALEFDCLMVRRADGAEPKPQSAGKKE